jgi:hypothetical protein
MDRIFTNSGGANNKKPLKPSGFRGLEVMVPRDGIEPSREKPAVERFLWVGYSQKPPNKPPKREVS